MNLVLKLEHYDDIDQDIIKAINTAEAKRVKLTTNRLDIERDRKDERLIKSLKGVKVIYEMEFGILILIGNLSCRFRDPFGGEFFLRKAYVDYMTSYEDVNGVDVTIQFTNNPCSIEAMRDYLSNISENEDFKFNLSQFDEFMEIFEYYKNLSDELNNNASFDIKSISESYYFLPYNVKGIRDEEGEIKDELNGLQQITDTDGLLRGYVVPVYVYNVLDNDLVNHVLNVNDITIGNEDDTLKKLKKMNEDIYVSNFFEVNERTAWKLKNVELVNVIKEKTELTLTVVGVPEDEVKYLNIYDMGQKIKVDSIDNSLRLINQGATGAAIEMIEYLIGSKAMLNTGLGSDEIKETYMRGLNDSQKQAFLKAVDGSPVTLIKGPPGTGKTHVINAITQYITKELDEKVIISSQTHVAIDNVLDKLMENHDIVIPNRITNRRNKYSDLEIDRTLYRTWGRQFDQHNTLASNQDLAKRITSVVSRFEGEQRIQYSTNIANKSDYMVIGATTTTSAIAGKKGLEVLEGYNWLVIDEVSKCPITEVLRYLPYVDKIIMVGDDYQLAPLLEFSKEDVQHLPSYDEDMFEKLSEVYQKSVFADTIIKAEESGRLVVLNENYRSVKNVLRAYNVFYGGNLENKREKVNPVKVRFEGLLSNFNDKDTMFVDVQNGSEQKDNKSHSRFNLEELQATAMTLNDLIDCTINPQDVTVAAIFPYAAQISKFTKKHKNLINKAKKKFKSFDVDTVDAFQGKESDIVLVNTVVTTSAPNFLNDFRRINVSMSRAKDKLIIFGNPFVLKKIQMKVAGGNKKKFLDYIIDDISKYGSTVTYKPGEGMNYEDTSKSAIKLK